MEKETGIGQIIEGTVVENIYGKRDENGDIKDGDMNGE